MGQTEMLYIGTGVMLLLSVTIIIFVVWTNKTLNRQREFIEDREQHWMRRIEKIEAIINDEFRAILDQLKKL